MTMKKFLATSIAVTILLMTPMSMSSWQTTPSLQSVLSQINQLPSMTEITSLIPNAYASASISLTPTSGLFGTSVTVQATGFSPSTTVTFSMAGTQVATCTSDSNGNCQATFVVPDGPTGSVQVTGDDGLGNTASATFTVFNTPEPLAILPGLILPGSSFVVLGGGFPAGDTINLASKILGGTTVQSPQLGNFAVTFTVPLTTAPGTPLQVTATDAANPILTSSSPTVPVTSPPGQDPTVVSLKLPSTIVATQSQQITITVTDPKTPTSNPTGKVSLTDHAGGTFTPAVCVLPGPCTIQYSAPSSTGEALIIATYSGDSTHGQSAASGTMTITAITSSPSVQGQVTIVQTCGINPSAGSLNYGNLTPGAASSTQTLTLSNTGTTSEGVQVQGTDWTSQSGTPSGTIIPVGSTTWQIPGGASYTPLTSSPANLISSLGFGANQLTDWILNVPTVTADPTIGTVTSGTVLQQTVTFTTGC